MMRWPWALVLLMAGCAAPRNDPPGLVLVTLDTFRQDHLGAAGSPHVRTPHLDRLARRGTLWRDAFTATPLTTPSHATILSGVAPATHGLLRNRARLDPSIPTLAEQLLESDFRTGAIVASRVVLDPKFGLDRGFGSYDVIEPARLPASGEGANVTTRAIEWLAQHGGPRSFLWVHFFDAHLPYLPPAPWGRVYGASADVASPVSGAAADPAIAANQRARYAGEVSFLDACVGRLARSLEARGDREALLVTADHGEGLGEHAGYFGHDVLLYDTAIRVPFLLATFGPGEAAAPRANTIGPGTARTIDVSPTLAGLANLAPGAQAEGRDLLREPETAGAAVAIETHPDPAKSAPRFGLRTQTAKAIFRPDNDRYEFFDLIADPEEHNDLGAEATAEHQALATALAAQLQLRPRHSGRTVDEESGGVDETTRRELESLGYVNR